MLIADGGGSVPPASVPAAAPTQQPPSTTSTQADAAARARELQHQLELMLERLREAQRRAEEARQRALEAQQRAETARRAAEAAKKKADQSGNVGDQAASAKARQDWKQQDAQMKKAAADSDLQHKDVALLRAQVAQKREQVKSHDGKASAAADQKVKDAQGARDAASRTSDLAKLYADAQDKESKAQDAEAKLASLRPRNRFEAQEFTPDQRSALNAAQADATKLRGDADGAQATFKTAIDKDADAAFYGSPPAGGTPPGVTPATAAAVGDDPLHSPLLQLLQVSGGGPTNAPLFTSAPGSTLANGSTWSANTTFSPLLTPAGGPASPQLARTLSGIADGKSLAQVASDQHMSVDQVVAQARAAGVDVQVGAPSGDVQVTTLRKGNDTLAYTHNLKDDSVTVKGSYADAGAPGGQRDVDVSRNRDGVYSQTVKDPKTGRDVVHEFNPAAGTRTEVVTAVDGTRTETTTDLTAAPVTHTVKDGEGYLDIAKDAGLTPEQLLALNPDVDYGAPLKAGQNLVVVGVQTTVKTFNPDHTSLERSTASDGTLHVVATDASGHRAVLMGDPDPSNPQADAIRKALFDDKKTIAQAAASLGLTEQQLVEALPPGTVDDAPASVDNQGIRTRTIYDPQTNRSFVEIDDPRHDRTVVQEIAADQVFHVRQYDTETHRYVMQDVRGGAGYAQSLADQRQATADDYGKQISDLDNTIRLFHHTGDDPSELLAQRATLVAQQKAAQGQADIAQGKASAVMTRHEQVQVDQSAAIAYQNWFVARPGSKDQAAAAVELQNMLALSDKVDRLVASSDKDVGLLVAGVDKQRADDAKSAADDKLQAAFQHWKTNDWGWGAIPKEQADKMKAKGERPPYLPYYQDAQQENDAAWSDFVDMQKDMDKYGTDGYPPSMVAAHAAWVQRNQASDAALKVDLRFDDASSASNLANQNVLQGDIARLEQDKANWVQANPDKFKENYGNQKQLDQLNASLAQDQIDALNLGEDKKFTQYMTTVSAPDREDPGQLKKAEQKYAKDNQDATTQLNRRIDELQTGGMVAKDKAAEAYIAGLKTRDPALAAKLDALGSLDPPGTQGSVRAAEYRQEQTALLLKGSDEGKQLQDAMDVRQQVYDQFLQRGGEDVQHVQGDRDAIKKDIDGHTFVRDIWDACGGDDASKDALKYTDGQLDKATQLRNDLASGKISVSDFASQEDQFLNRYDHTSGDFQRRIQDSDGTWSVVDEAVRTTVSAAAGIAATIASGGNVAVGFAVGLGVSELWDTAGDIVAAAQGRDVNADGHTSLLTLEAKAATGQASWDDVKFTLKEEAIDVASNAVTLTGVGAGARVTESLTAQLALKDSLSVGGRTLLKVGFKEGSTDTLTWGGRAIVGAGAGVTSQAVDGVGRVGVETLHVGLDGQLGTEEGGARIRSTIAASAAGLLTSPVTGAFSGAIPLRTGLPGLGIGGQVLNDTVGSLGTGELVSLATEGRTMNRGEVIAASLNIGPSVLQHVAIHPMMARAQARAEADARSGAPGARNAVPDDASGDVAAPSTRATDDEQVLFQQAGDDMPVAATKQLPLYGDKPWVAPPAARPRLDKPAGQRIVDLVHMAGPNAPQSMTGRTIGLTELADGRVVVTVSGKKANLNPNQRRVAQLLLRESGFESGDILMLEVTKGNKFGVGHKARHLDPDTRPVSWHAEQKGIQAGKLAGSDAVRQWSSSGKNPRGTEQGGHGGAACPVCQLAQADYRVVNETGLQPPEGEPATVLLSDGRAWGGRDDRVDREIPGVDWESLRTRPDFLDPPKPATTTPAKPGAPLAAKPATPAAADDPLAQAARRGGASPQAPAGWDDRFLQRVALHPDVQDALLEVIRQEHTGKGANAGFDLDMLYGNEQRVRGTARDNPQMFRRQVLAAWHALERAGHPVDIDGRTPIVTARPTSYRIRPGRDFEPQLDSVKDYADALKGVTSQSNEIAKALGDGRIKVELLSGADYRAKMRALGKDPGRVLAMAKHDVVTLNQDARPWERLLSMVHEGTHALDWIDMRSEAKTSTIPIGDLEGRAYFHENEFAQAMGLHGRSGGDAFPALVRPQVLHPTMRDTHQHIDAAYPQATSPWRPTEKASTDATALDQRSGPPPAGADAVQAAFARGLHQAGLDVAHDPAGLLFRVDTQSPDTLRAAGGVRPRPGVGAITRPSLSNYVEGNTPGRWVGTSKSVRHIANFVADHPERVQPGETAWLYVVNPAARTRQDVMAHYVKSGGLDGLQPPIRRAVEREGEVAVDGGMPWAHVLGWAEVDPATGEFAGPFQHNPDYAAPVARPRQVVLRMPDGSPAQPPAGAAAAAAPDPAQVARATLPDLSTGWQPVLRLPARTSPDASAAPAATPALFVVQHAGSGPKSVFDPASGQWIEARPAAAAAPDPAAQAAATPPAPATQPVPVTQAAPVTATTTSPSGHAGSPGRATQPNTVRVTLANAHAPATPATTPAATTTPPAAATTAKPPAATNLPGTQPAAPLAPPTRRRVYVSAAAGLGALGGAGALAAIYMPANILGTAFSWATAGAAVRSGVKLVRFSQARKWEGRVANMSDKVAAKASFEQALDGLDALGRKRLAAGADPQAHADFTGALAQVRDHASRLATVPVLRRVTTLRKSIADLHDKAVDLGIPKTRVARQTSRLKAGATDRAAFDRYLALHQRFVEKGKSGSRRMRWMTGVDADKANLIGQEVGNVNAALGRLGKSGNGVQERTDLRDAVRGLSVAPRLRDKPNSVARWTIDMLQAGTYAVSLGSLANSIRTAPRFSFSAAGHQIAAVPHFVHSLVTTPHVALPELAHAITSLPTEWPGVVVSSVFAVSTLADGARILGSRFAMKETPGREPVTTHPLYAKTLPKADDSATVHGGAASVVKGALFGEHKAADTAAALAYTVGAWRQRREARGRDYVDPKPDEIAARKKVFNRKIVAAGAGLVLAGEALASQWLKGEDKKKKDDLGPATPPATPTTIAPPTGTPTTPGMTPPGPAPVPRSKLVVVDASDPRTAALWGIAHANESSLLSSAEIRRVRDQAGDDAVTLDALRHLFQLNPQRGFRPSLMDGVPGPKQGDPDTIQPGWKIEVQDPALP
ncbi:MAG: hypothetical protein ACJ8IK_19970 [Burkholderiaceae bacterium]